MSGQVGQGRTITGRSLRAKASRQTGRTGHTPLGVSGRSGRTAAAAEMQLFWHCGKDMRRWRKSDEADRPTPSAPTNADHRQDGDNGRQSCSTDQQPVAGHSNDRHRKDDARLVVAPIGRPSIALDGPTAAADLVRWAAEHDLAHEWKVDDLCHIATEDFAPAHEIELPPRRVFLGALKKTPGVICMPNRRVYDRKGNLQGKTTFYRLPTTPEVRTAAEPPALRVVKHAA